MTGHVLPECRVHCPASDIDQIAVRIQHPAGEIHRIARRVNVLRRRLSAILCGLRVLRRRISEREHKPPLLGRDDDARAAPESESLQPAAQEDERKGRASAAARGLALARPSAVMLNSRGPPLSAAPPRRQRLAMLTRFVSSSVSLFNPLLRVFRLMKQRHSRATRSPFRLMRKKGS
jgi:hypothetical protein